MAKAEIPDRDSVQTIESAITARAQAANEARFASLDDIDPSRWRHDNWRRGPCCTISEHS